MMWKCQTPSCCSYVQGWQIVHSVLEKHPCALLLNHSTLHSCHLFIVSDCRHFLAIFIVSPHHLFFEDSLHHQSSTSHQLTDQFKRPPRLSPRWFAIPHLAGQQSEQAEICLSLFKTQSRSGESVQHTAWESEVTVLNLRILRGGKARWVDGTTSGCQLQRWGASSKRGGAHKP